MSIRTSVSKEQGKPLTRLPLRANFSWTFGGNVIYAATQWGMLVLLTKLFEPAVFGQYALALSIVTPIFTGSAMQLRVVQVTDLESTATFADYLLLRLVTNVLALICIALITLLGLLPSHIFVLALLLGLNQAILLIKDIFNGVMQKHERMDLVALSTISMGAISLGAVTVVAFLTRDILLMAVSNVVAGIASVLMFDVPCVRRLRVSENILRTKYNIWQSPNISQLLTLARTAFPLGIVMLFISLYLNVPRYFLASSGEANVGFFAAVASLVAVQELVIGALGQSAIPKLSRYYVSNKAAYMRLLTQLAVIFFVIGIAGVVVAIPLSSQILALLFRSEYARFANVFVWLLVAKVILNVKSAIGYGTTSARIFSPQIWIEGISVATLCALAWLLVPQWGGLGAAWAILGSAMVGLAASGFVLFRDLKNKVEDV